ncbi:recombinase family protein [Flavobacteriaceae bacterium]|nr:recombinase family protein [Flavobacteriaceae bacterium]MDB4280914.1 recombinase family protein [Flavobacteriaceae bacterium]MDB4326816.1 recombinase family protein [Flavobacteriaceae bacterium]
MKPAKYERVSTKEQSTARQRLTKLEDGTPVLEVVDKCSGVIPFKERDNAPKLLVMAKRGDIDTLMVHSIDRLGRNTIDILKTVQEFTEMGVNVVSKTEGLQTLIDGKENPTTKMILSIMATLAEWELKNSKERQAEGIERARKNGRYKNNGGNKPKETTEQFFNKSNVQMCLKELKNGESINRASKIAGVSYPTAQKVMKLAIIEGML